MMTDMMTARTMPTRTDFAAALDAARRTIADNPADLFAALQTFATMRNGSDPREIVLAMDALNSHSHP